MWLRVSFAIFLLAICRISAQELKKKATEPSKRVVETYSYPVPIGRFDSSQGNAKSKVIVETIKSISPSEYLSSSGYLEGTLGNTDEASAAGGKVPVGTISYSAFEPAVTEKAPIIRFANTESAPAKKKINYKYYLSSNAQESSNVGLQSSSTNPPASVRTTSTESASTQSGYQYPKASKEPETTEKSLHIISTRGRPGSGRYSLQKIAKKPAKIERKISDSAPEETGFNGYQYEVGGSSFGSTSAGSQGGGMMGLSYMRSSSPFYNFHVMLD